MWITSDDACIITVHNESSQLYICTSTVGKVIGDLNVPHFYFTMHTTFQFQGHDVIDTDIPSRLEARLFCTTLGKFVWVVLQPLFYALRPLFSNPKVPLKLEYVNTAIQLCFNYFVYQYFGGKVLFYLLGGSLMAMGLHPGNLTSISIFFLINFFY